MAADSLKIEIDADTREAIANLAKLKDGLGDAKEATEEVDQASQGWFATLGDGAHRVESIVGVMSEALSVARDLASAFVEGAANSETHQRALRALGDGFQRIQVATAGTISATEAFHTQQRILASGLRVSTDQLATITRAAREYALRTGTDVPQALEQLTEALQSGSADELQKYGVTLQANIPRTQAFRDGVSQLATAQQGAAVSARTMAESTERLSGAAQRAKDDVSAFVADALQLKDAFNEAADALEAFVSGGPLIHNFFEAMSADILGVRAHMQGTAEDRNRSTEQLARERAVNALAQFANTPGINVRGFNANQLSGPDAERLSRALTSGTADPARIQAEIDRARNIVAGTPALEAQWARDRAQRERAANAADDARARSAAMSPEERRRLFHEAELRRMEREINFKRATLQGQLTNEYAANTGSFFTDDMNVDVDTVFETQRSMRADMESKQRAQLAYEEELAQERRSQLLSPADHASAMRAKSIESEDLDAGNTFGARIGGAFRNTQTHAERTADSVKGAFDTMTQGLSGFMDTLIESPEKAGEASVALAKGVLKGIAMMALQKSLFSTAEGIVALTNPVTAPTAAGFFAAAGIYAGVAVAAGAGAAGIAASQRGGTQATPPSSNGGGFGPARADSGRSGGQRGGDTYVISVNGSILDTGGFEEAVGRAVRGARGRGA